MNPTTITQQELNALTADQFIELVDYADTEMHYILHDYLMQKAISEEYEADEMLNEKDYARPVLSSSSTPDESDLPW